ncbi:hypothetical protein K3U93_22105 [Mycobacterium malmoense]|uniref:PE-PGRS family protein n=1 Tax=Mycobacterium malmoense TaxID=1780 RepID=A0ABX3SM48_MYCMA|nr:hypothetical protein [Mycobacterium malmoense]OIN81937.1 hypothetical protein BMG05_05010 [Mycobacterium malmoense]ORA76454.1 hypothetical protein BST29_24535 [Mycobacterium malmoense]QZA17248.1 hypothetical protein K3U93_22105 [Mycobacterium malmoense]UNB94038.1 hypothetical protein H5T25_22080 [Mycobacterium malmoense]
MIALTPVVSSDVASDLQRSAASIQHRAVQLMADDIVNPIQAWTDLFQTTATNLQTVTQEWLALPFPVLQQFAANWAQYAYLDIATDQIGLKAAFDYFTGSGISNGFFPTLSLAFQDLSSGNVAGYLSLLLNAFYENPIFLIGYPMEAALQIPEQISTNFANAVNSLLEGGVVNIGIYALGGPSAVTTAFGNSLQASVDAANSGNLLGAATNLLSVPAETLNGFINGIGTGQVHPDYGLINPPPYESLFQLTYTDLAKDLAQAIVTPNAQNIVGGGSLAAGVDQLVNQFLNGWPSVQNAINQLINTIEGLFGGGAATAEAVNSSSVLAGLATGPAELAAHIPVDVAASLPGDVANIAGHLGVDLASVLPGMILSVLHF